MLTNILLVGLGGGIGSMLRYTTALLIPSRLFPYATLTVNIVGCFIIGLVMALSARNEHFAQTWKLFLATGICGGFTTFSAFSAENMHLLQLGRPVVAAMYILLSVVVSIAAAFLGYALANYKL